MAEMGDQWFNKPIENILLDINGVLTESGTGQAIDGSVEAINSLIQNDFKICLVTNECTTSVRSLAYHLQGLGFKSIRREDIIAPAPMAEAYIKDHGLRPKFFICPNVLEDFGNREDEVKNPNCLVVGYPINASQDYMDECVEAMKNSSEEKSIVALGLGRYFKDGNRLRMDTGAFTAAFEFALGVKAVNVGKPAKEFFQRAISKVEGTIDNTIMIGDDVLSDVAAAKEVGMRGFLVRTGKYRPSDEHLATSDQVFDNLKDAADSIIARKISK